MGAGLPFIWYVSALAMEASKWPVDTSRLDWWGEIAGDYGVMTIAAYLIHALIARYWIRRGCRKSTPTLLAVWGGSIGITISFGVIWLSIFLLSVRVILKDDFPKNFDGMDLWFIFHFAFIVGLLLNIIGYIFGYCIGTVLNRVLEARRANP
jgi:hypothetical protein